MKVFVYGTLKRGFCRHAALHQQTLLGTAVTEPHYQMVNVGTYPGLISAEPGVPVEGEVWEVDPTCLARLDEIESVTSELFHRRPVQLQAPFGQQPIEAYFFGGSTDGLPDCGTCW